MANPNLVERLAELLDLPIEVIQAYGKPQERVSFRAARKKVGTVSEVNPLARYATLKAVADIPPAEEAAPPKNVENELYAQWRDASDAEKPKMEKKLFNSILRRARNVIWKKIPEAHEDLARDIASVVIEQLAEFKGQNKSEFTTWEHRIILNQCNVHLRKKVKDRKRFYVSESPEDDIKLADSKAKYAFDRVEEGLDLERLVQTLPRKDHVLLGCVLDGMTMLEAAEKLGDTEDAAESRLRRLKARLKKKIEGKGDGK
jgi:RNA polymerase sigma factor (sigma-70 family)